MSAVVAEEFERDGVRYVTIGYPALRLACLADLTVSELEVVLSWIQGLDMREIAGERGSSRRTVANQLASAYRKLGVASRSELIRKLRPETRARESV